MKIRIKKFIFLIFLIQIIWFFKTINDELIHYCMDCNHRTNAKAVSRAYYGTDNSIIIFLDDVNCTGEESHIAQCTKIGDWGLHNCDHREDAGVNCTFGKYKQNNMVCSKKQTCATS